MAIGNLGNLSYLGNIGIPQRVCNLAFTTQARLTYIA